MLVQGLVGIAVFLVVVIGFMDRRPSWFWLAIVALAGYSYWRGSTVLRVDGDGVRIGRGFGYAYGDTRPLTALVPWSSVDEVLLISTGVGEEQVAVRLRADAPLPWDVRGVIRDPDAPDPVAPELRTAIPAGKLDRPALAAAVAAFGGGVALVDRTDA